MADLSSDATIAADGQSINLEVTLDSSTAQTVYKGHPIIIDRSVDTLNCRAWNSSIALADDDEFIGLAATSGSVSMGADESTATLDVWSGLVTVPNTDSWTTDDEGMDIWMPDSGTFSLIYTTGALFIGQLYAISEDTTEMMIALLYPVSAVGLQIVTITDIIPSNLSNTPTSTTVDIDISTGTGTTLPAATTSLAGVMTAADKTIVDSAVVESRTVTAGDGLTGGGDLSANRTINVGAGDGINVNADTIEVDVTDILGNHLSESSNNIDVVTTSDADSTVSTIIAGDANGRIKLDGLAIGSGTAESGGVVIQEDGFVGIGSSLERFEFDGSNNRIEVKSADLQVAGDIVPEADGTRDLGTLTERWAEVHADSIDLDGVTLTGVSGAALGIVANILQRIDGSLAANTISGVGALAAYARLIFRGAKGSLGAETAIASTNLIGQIHFEGYGTTAYGSRNAAIEARAGEAFTDTNQGTQLIFITTPNGGTASAIKMTIQSGVVIGSPTGGDKGNGTLNATAVYDDNTLLTDYVFEANYNLIPISAMERYFTEHKHLPTIDGRDVWDKDGKPPLGKLVNQLWETIEVQARYIAELNKRLEALENA